MFNFNKKNTIITHNGSFHADEVFAVATLKLALGGKVEIIRTRNLSGASLRRPSPPPFFIDVGGEYDPTLRKFDHHQQGGAGKRENLVSHASFGLIWKQYGEEACQSKEAAKGVEMAKEVANFIDRMLVQPIDLVDNGEAVAKPLFADVYSYSIGFAISSFNAADSSDDALQMKQFCKAVTMAVGVLEREIKNITLQYKDRGFVEQAYQDAKDKRIIILEKECSWLPIIMEHSEPLFVVEPAGENWKIKTVNLNFYSFKNRKDLPESWAGKKDEELQKITGVADAVFCHNKRFIAVARSKEGALRLADLALRG
jgi:uncharacterized UPF0160 family protein